MNDDQIKHMVDRFLTWKLPADFWPDAGISFKNGLGQSWPIGTNLLTATQAKAMVRHMLEGIEALTTTPTEEAMTKDAFLGPIGQREPEPTHPDHRSSSSQSGRSSA